jgi:hypothetical protein
MLQSYNTNRLNPDQFIMDRNHRAYRSSGMAELGDFLGSHPTPHTFHHSHRKQESPITAGVEDYDVFDEQHMSKCILDQQHILLHPSLKTTSRRRPVGGTSSVRDVCATIAWAHGGGDQSCSALSAMQ